MMKRLTSKINALRFGPGYEAQSAEMRAEVRRVGMRVNADGETYLPAVPFHSWPLIKLGTVAFQGPKLFVWQHDHYMLARLGHMLNGGGLGFWTKYAKCRILKRHHFMMSTVSFPRKPAEESFKCACCMKPVSAMIIGKDVISISEPMKDGMRKDGVPEHLISGLARKSAP